MSRLQAESPGREFVIVGGGGHARVVLDLLQKLGKSVAGYTAPEPSNEMPSSYLGTDGDLMKNHQAPTCLVAIGVGLPSSNPERAQLLEQFVNAGFEAPSIISPNAVIAHDVELGIGSAVFAGAILAVGSQIGKGAIVNHNATIDHDCEVGKNAHIGPGATICGGVQIGSHCLIGAGATVLPGISIMPGCTIAAGATIVRNINTKGVYVGSPAKRSK